MLRSYSTLEVSTKAYIPMYDGSIVGYAAEKASLKVPYSERRRAPPYNKMYYKSIVSLRDFNKRDVICAARPVHGSIVTLYSKISLWETQLHSVLLSG